MFVGFIPNFCRGLKTRGRKNDGAPKVPDVYITPDFSHIC